MQILDDSNNKPTNPLIKNKYIIIVFILSFMGVFLGALGKINSEPWGGAMITTGLSFSMLGFILIIIKLAVTKDMKSFPNR